MPTGDERNYAVYAELTEGGRTYSSRAGAFRFRQALTLDLSDVVPTAIEPNVAAQTVAFVLKMTKSDLGPTAEDMDGVSVELLAGGVPAGRVEQVHPT